MPGKADSDEESADAETRCWAWASLVMGGIVLVFALATGAWPVILLQLASVTGSLFFLFGSKELRRAAVIMLGVSAAFELIGGLVAFVVGIWLTVVPGVLGGFGFLLGFYALMFSVPVLGIGAVDFYTVYRVRKAVFGGQKSGKPESNELLQVESVPPVVNLSMRVTERV